MFSNKKTPYLDKTNDDTEEVVQNLHNSGWKQKFEHQRNYKYTTILFGFSGSLLPRPSRDTLRQGGMGQEKLTIVFNALAG